MIFELTGNFKGEYVQEKVVGPRDLIEEFGLDHLKDKDEIVVEIDKSTQGMMATNKADGKARSSRLQKIPTIIHGQYNGETYTIRAYDTKIPVQDRNGTSYRYAPSRIRLRGTTEVVGLTGPDADISRAVFLSLATSTRNSPFFRRNNTSMYVFVDKKAKTESRLVHERIIQNTINMIFTETNGLRVQRIAKGLVLPGNVRLGADQTKTPDMSKLALINLARTNPDLVVNAWNDDGTHAAGMAFQAVDQGLIKVVSLGGGRQAWRWSDNGTEIARIDPGVSPREALEDWVKQPANYSNFSKGLNKRHGVDDQETVPSGPIKAFSELHDIDLIKLALEHEMIFFDRKKNRVYQLNDNGQIAGDMPIVVVKGDPDGWMDEAAQNLKSPAGRSLVKTLREKFE